MAEADPAGPSGDVGEEGFWRAHMRIVAERGVLDAPDGVEAAFLGEDHLIDDLAENPGVAGARLVFGLGFVND